MGCLGSLKAANLFTMSSLSDEENSLDPGPCLIDRLVDCMYGLTIDRLVDCMYGLSIDRLVDCMYGLSIDRLVDCMYGLSALLSVCQIIVR